MLGADVAEPRAAAHHIDEDPGHLGPDHPPPPSRTPPQQVVVAAGVQRDAFGLGAEQAGAEVAERSPNHIELLQAMLEDPTLAHVHFDISWDEVAKYAVSSQAAIDRLSQLLNAHPDRFLFGTDNVAPNDQATQMHVYDMWSPIWANLTPEASRKVRLGTYERLFGGARGKVRAWEAANVK